MDTSASTLGKSRSTVVSAICLAKPPAIFRGMGPKNTTYIQTCTMMNIWMVWNLLSITSHEKNNNNNGMWKTHFLRKNSQHCFSVTCCGSSFCCGWVHSCSIRDDLNILNNTDLSSRPYPSFHPKADN